MIGRRLWWAVALVSGVVLLTACGGESASDVYGDVDPASGVADDSGEVSTDGGADIEAVEYAELDVDDGGSDIAQDARLELIDFYEDFRWSADFESIGEDSFLEDYAVADVVSQFENEAAENRAKLDDDLGTGDIARYSVTEVTSVEGTVQDAVLTSCNEVLADRENGMQVIQYQNEQVRVESVDGDWMITDRSLLHDGSRDEPTLGCVPSSFAERSAEVMEEFLASYYEAYRDPAGVDSAVLDLLEFDLAADMSGELESFAAQGVVVDVPIEHTVEVLGSDNFRSWRTFAVNVCSTYPEGLGVKDAGSGEWVGDVNFVGESLSLDYRVWFSLPESGEELEWKILDRGQPNLVDGCDRGESK